MAMFICEYHQLHIEFEDSKFLSTYEVSDGFWILSMYPDMFRMWRRALHISLMERFSHSTLLVADKVTSADTFPTSSVPS